MSDQPYILPMTEIDRHTTETGMQVTTFSNMEAARQQVMRQSGEKFTPDFIMAGVATPTGVMLFASTELTDAELVREMKGFDRVPLSDSPHAIVARVPSVKVTLTAQMKTFTIIQATDYPSALSSLQDLWSRKSSPGDSGLPAISR